MEISNCSKFCLPIKRFAVTKTEIFKTNYHIFLTISVIVERIEQGNGAGKPGPAEYPEHVLVARTTSGCRLKAAEIAESVEHPHTAEQVLPTSNQPSRRTDKRERRDAACASLCQALIKGKIQTSANHVEKGGLIMEMGLTCFK